MENVVLQAEKNHAPQKEKALPWKGYGKKHPTRKRLHPRRNTLYLRQKIRLNSR